MSGTEQTFRSPNYYEREVDLSAPQLQGPVGTPAGIIGTSNKGPAFVPVTVANFDEFVATFGNLDPKKYGPYAANEFLKHRNALTFLRVLGAGANSTDGDIAATIQNGRVANAGVKIEGSIADGGDKRHVGSVQFLTARHMLQTNEAYGMPIFTDNRSFTGGFANLVRGMVLLASGARMMVLDGDQSAVGAFVSGGPDDAALPVSGKFKLVISSTLGNAFVNTDGNAGVKILTASLDPTSADYFGKIMNIDPDRFVQEQHLLYGDFAVDDELATPTVVAAVSGSALTSATSGDTTLAFRNMYGAFNTRYKTPKTTMFISQPFGATEHDLFSFEALDDGEFANKLYKISIANIKASLDDAKPYGTFTVHIRDWNDTDQNPIVLESYPNCSLDPNADNYIAKLIGDRKVFFNFDAAYSTERRLVATGKYENVSKLVRVQVSDAVDRGIVPGKALPFGFRGLNALKTNDLLTDTAAGTNNRLAGVLGVGVGSALTGSVVPPVPFRFKVTKGAIPTTAAFEGAPGPTELANSSLYWGVKFERNTDPLNSNITSEKNRLLEAYTKFLGIEKLDALVTGSGADTFCNNKFTLAKVAFSNTSIAALTGTINDHIREAAYIRNANVDLADYTINTAIGKRITFATILAQDTAANFNKWSPYAKFTNLMFGGFDGVNFLDRDARRLNDKSTSFDTGGAADVNYIAPGLKINPNGAGQSNASVLSYMTAIDIMTDPMVVNTNILAIPGIRESFVTDYAMKKARDYGLAFYVMDIPSYDDLGARLYDDSTTRPDVEKTNAAVDTRAIDNNYAATYFPNVFIDDATNRRKVKVPASVAALGALAFNDRVAYPWFAPAGFNRAALDFVSNVEVRLNSSDRDKLSDSRINPIAVFPKLGFVIYGQKTLQVAKSALDRVNVRRLLLEVKRIIIGIAQNMVFEQNTAAVRAKFTSDASLQLGLIQTQAGVEQFKVICNESNNTQEDIDLNKLNGRIVIVPTRVFENIAIDFIITNSGVEFTS